ncbi:MAG TPA: flagellar basal body rod protein FlgB [Firmicutes bacterium]|nr:flagellar basal body rod protein FlgB [Bacillota bacterium]
MFKTVNKLSLGLDKASLRHEVLSDNLANVNTPGFKRSDVQSHSLFAQQLGQMRTTQLRRTNAGHLTAASRRAAKPFSVVTDHTSSMRNDGSNVDMERERVYLLENQLYYDSLIDAVSRKLSQIRSVIGEGRR